MISTYIVSMCKRITTLLPRIKVLVLTFSYSTRLILFSIYITVLVFIKRTNFTSASKS